MSNFDKKGRDLEEKVFKKIYILFKYGHNLRDVMIRAGFDFSYIGSTFVHELIQSTLVDKDNQDPYSEQRLIFLADKYNLKIKSIHRDVYWAIIEIIDTSYSIKFVDSFEIMINVIKNFLNKLYQIAVKFFVF